ncbi:uncharacterized protein Aud_001705 [Aspergillus udagawae]|uniref:Uncharacterized protein n=1 Tax=Aspergillus udagawae TaxID=91492 RepID=A0A8E0QK85_9EURO|nr:uncharacterized protein Aud_001705 [Aspergillus udagawae]GIC85865.1 hypothetical protein Aud_001705 [Aspergillus udagawae]
MANTTSFGFALRFGRAGPPPVQKERFLLMSGYIPPSTLCQDKLINTNGVSPDQELQSIDARSLSRASYADSLKEWLHDERFKFETVEDVDIVKLTHQKRSNDEADLVHHAIAQVLHLGGINQTLAVDPSNLKKRARFGHEGFKISFTTRQGSALTAADQDDMATAIAFD